MLDIYKKTLALFPVRERRQLPLIALATLFMSVLQVAGIGSVMPFLAVVADPSVIQRKAPLRWLFETLGFHSTAGFLLMLGSLSFAVLLVGNVASALIAWWMVRFAESRTHYLASVLLERYLNRPYIFFLQKNSADLGVNILSEVVQVVSGILLPGLQLLAQAAMAGMLILFLVTVNARLALVVFVGLGGAYFGIYRLVRGRLTAIGQQKTQANAMQFRALSETSGAIKEIKFLNLERVFIDRFKTPNRAMARMVAAQSVLSMIPSYAMETIAFGGILIVVLYMLSVGKNVAQVLPLVGLYAYSILRIKPALQVAYSSITQIRFNEGALANVYREFQSGEEGLPGAPALLKRDIHPLTLRDNIELRGVTFQYPGSGHSLFRDLNLTIPARGSVAFVGPTGSGKTSIVDMILGLLEPDEGHLLVDGSPITPVNRREWQANISYVPQHIYLSDDTVLTNIAFGVDSERVDNVAVERAARMAKIHDFVVDQLPLGYDTLVGERGVRLSGGQRQRIGIARALYREAQVLVMDEATNALDGITEDSVFESLRDVARTRTIILVAHRVSTVRDCEKIFLLDHGKIIATGTFDELIAGSDQFRAMAHMFPLAVTVS